MAKRARPDSIPKRNERIQWREFGSEAILLDPTTGAFMQINDTGVLIWKHVNGRATLEEIVAAVSDHFDADDGAVAEDVAAFIEELVDKKALSLD